MDDIHYQLNFSIYYVATGGHCYATLTKTDIYLIAFDRLVAVASQNERQALNTQFFRAKNVVQSQ